MHSDNENKKDCTFLALGIVVDICIIIATIVYGISGKITSISDIALTILGLFAMSALFYGGHRIINKH